MATNDESFDFYILYEEENAQDRKYAELILNGLETHQSLKGFVDFRDAIMGQTIFKNLEMALNNSRFVLVLISNESIRDKWWDRQVETTLYHRLHSEHKDSVVPVYLPNFNMQNIPVPLSILNGVCYESEPNSRFWRKLCRVFQ